MNLLMLLILAILTNGNKSMFRFYVRYKNLQLTRRKSPLRLNFYILRWRGLHKNFTKPEYGKAEYDKWIQHKTFAAFIRDVGCKKDNPLVSKIAENITKQQEVEMVFNMTRTEFNFAQEKVTISYFLVDSEYPDVHLPFEELSKVFSYAKKFFWR